MSSPNLVTTPPEAAEKSPSATESNHPPSRYRLAQDRADQIRTAPPVIMNIFEAAAYLACSPRKLRDLIQRRRVKSARIGSKIILRREWLDALIGK
jgi:excisionase family DNA binding protein